MNNLKNSVNIKYILELLCMIFLYAMLDNVGGIKKYIILLGVCMILLCLGRKNKWSVDALFCIALPIVVYVLQGSLSALLATNSQVTTVKVIIYVLVPLVFTFSLYVYYGKEMLRIVKTKEEEILLDVTGKLNGRGAYIHLNRECFDKAVKSKGLERSFKMSIGQDIYEKLGKEMMDIE